jgi:hypothetical protein
MDIQRLCIGLQTRRKPTMAQVIAGRRDVDFVLHEQLNVGSLSEHETYAEFNKKTIDLIVSEARNLAIKEILPTFKEGDEQGCRFENGQVFVPESFKRAYELFIDGGWLAMTEDPEYGGQGMPRTVALAASDYFNGANYAFMMYPGLTTSAMKNADGTYSITGAKIFISAGEHDMAENIVHPVLARIEGAPAGTKGISLFLVPKYRVNEDGSLGPFNDVVCTGIEHKMGINGNATCSLTLGGKGNCIGELLGEENKGMRAMFLMMNEARLLVGLQGLSCASASYLNALNYARERIQGKNLLQMMNSDAPSVPIIQHPDVRRMLISMKAYVEGMRSLLYYAAFLTDRMTVSTNEDEKARFQGMLDLLIPICKGYVTDRAFDICSTGVQVYGGYGYIKEYPQEQLLRDCRITLIYEGTNGIQAMDLLGRKLGMNKGKPIMDLMGEIQHTIAQAQAIDSLGAFAARLEKALNRLGEVAMHLGATAMSPKVMNAFAFAHPFLEASGDVILAWMLLWRGVIAAKALDKGGKKKDRAFYEGQLKSVQFFTQAVLPITMGKMDAVMTTSSAAVDISDDAFG